MKLLRLVAVNIGILALGLLVLELYFGSWIVDNRVRHLNLIVDRLYVHDVSSLYDNGGRPIVYRRDEYGLRGDYESPDSIDILTLGGSTTDQKYITEGETWQDVVRDRFAREGRTVSVVNGGVDGHSTRGHLRSFAWWFPNIPDLAPRYILYYVGINDSHVGAVREFDRLRGDESASWADELRERSGLYYAYRTLHGIWQARQRKIARRRVNFARLHWVSAPGHENHAQRSKLARMSYARRLERLIRLTRDLGAEPVVVTQLIRSFKIRDGRTVGVQSANVGNGVDESIKMRLFNRTTMDVCRRQSAICIDLATDLRTAFEDRDFYDFVHTTPSAPM